MLYSQRTRSVSPFERVDGVISKWLTRFNFRDVSKRTAGYGTKQKGQREKITVKGERVEYTNGDVEFIPTSKELFSVKCE